MMNDNNKERIYRVLPQIQGAMKALKDEGEWLYAINEKYIQVSGKFFLDNFGYGNIEKICRPWDAKVMHVEVEYAGLRIVAVVNDPDFAENWEAEDEEESV